MSPGGFPAEKAGFGNMPGGLGTLPGVRVATRAATSLPWWGASRADVGTPPPPTRPRETGDSKSHQGHDGDGPTGRRSRRLPAARVVTMSRVRVHHRVIARAVARPIDNLRWVGYTQNK